MEREAVYVIHRNSDGVQVSLYIEADSFTKAENATTMETRQKCAVNHKFL